MTKYSCDECNFHTSKKTDYSRHCKTKKHQKKVQQETEKQERQKNSSSFLLISPHSEEEPRKKKKSKTGKHKCTICCKIFSTKWNLNRHLMSCEIKNKGVKKVKKSTKKKKCVIQKMITCYHEENEEHLTDTSRTPSENEENEENYARNICRYCGKVFKWRSSLSRHKNRCKDMKIMLMENEKRMLETKLNNEKKMLEQKLEHKDQLMEKEIEKERLQKEIYQEQAGYYKGIYEDSNNLVKATMSSFRTLSQYLVNAPPLESSTIDDLRRVRDEIIKVKLLDAHRTHALQNIKIEEVECSDDESVSVDDEEDIEQEVMDIVPIKKRDDDLVEDLLQHYGDGTIHKYIGNIIIILYKKDNEMDQAIFNSDTSRLTYIISRVLKDGNTKWHIDKGGIDTKKLIIKPIMEGLRPIIVEYHTRKCKNGEEVDDFKRLLIEQRTLMIIKEIDNETIHDKILKFIAPKFYIDDTVKQKVTKKTITDKAQ